MALKADQDSGVLEGRPWTLWEGPLGWVCGGRLGGPCTAGPQGSTPAGTLWPHELWFMDARGMEGTGKQGVEPGTTALQRTEGLH